MNFENYNISSYRRNSECNLKKDERLNYCLSVLDLEQLINLFFENNISFIEMSLGGVLDKMLYRHFYPLFF